MAAGSRVGTGKGVIEASYNLKKAIQFSLGSDVDEDILNMITDIGPAMLFYQLIITGRIIEKSYIEKIITSVIMPLIHKHQA